MTKLPPTTSRYDCWLLPVPTLFVAVQIYTTSSFKFALAILRAGLLVVAPLYLACVISMFCSTPFTTFIHWTFVIPGVAITLHGIVAVWS